MPRAGVQWTAVAVKKRVAADTSLTADPLGGAAARQNRVGFRWPLQGIGRVAGKGDAAASVEAADGTPQGGLPCAAGCEEHGNCNRDSGRCE